MKILMLAVNDPAGMAIAQAGAINDHTGHTCRVATLESRYNHAWDADIHLPDAGPGAIEELGSLLRESDILHFHMTADENLYFGPYLPRDFLDGKTIVHHHHGHPDFRGNPEKYREKYARLGRRNLLVSTPDLLKFLPGAVWQPNLVDENDPLLTPQADKPAPPVKIAHSPTNKSLKNTNEFLGVVENLTKAGIDLSLELIDDAPHRDCLARKRLCHILFDHLQGYYGVSSLEGLAQGLAVVAGINSFCRDKILEFTGAERLPWVVSSLEKLERDLAGLVRDRDKREAIGRESRAFMVERWNRKRVARRLARFYETAA